MQKLNPFKNKIAAWGLWLIWCLMVLKFSSDPGEISGEKSGWIMAQILAMLNRLGLADLAPTSLHYLIRKGAHMVNYLCLGLISFNALRFGHRRPLAFNTAAVLALGLSLTFAGLDEFFQTFVPGRSGRLKDVLIDGGGTVIGLMGLSLWRYALRLK